MDKILKSKRKGSLLVTAMMLIIVLIATGMGMLGVGLSARKLAIQDTHKILARCAADAGLAKAMAEMNKKLQIQPWNNDVLPSETDASLLNCDATFSYTVTGNMTNGFTMTSTGKAGDVAKTVSTTLKLNNSFFTGITLKDSAVIESDAQVIAAPGSTTPKLVTNATGNNKITLNDVVFQGNIVVGPGGDPGSVVVGEEYVSGTISAATTATTFPVITPPAGLPQRGALKKSNTITADGQYSEIDLKGSGKLVTIQGNRTIYVTGNVSFDNSCQLIVASGSSLTLYVNGSFTIAGRAVVRSSDYNPAKLLVLATNNCINVDIGTRAVFYGGFYAPAATFRLSDEAEVHGAIGCNKLNALEAGGKLFYDDRVLPLTIPGAGSGRFDIRYWQDN